MEKVDDALKEMQNELGEDSTIEIEPNDFFKKLKDNLNTQELSFIANLLKVSIDNIKSAKKTGQEQLYISSLCLARTVYKEVFAVASGYKQFIHSDDLDQYVSQVKPANSIRVCDIKQYPRTIPDDVVKKFEEAKKIGFQHFKIVYTDYTPVEKGKQQAPSKTEQDIINRNKDPILLAHFSTDFTFFDKEAKKDIQLDYFSTNLFFIADWVDEYCDLTFSKMLQEMAKNGQAPNTDYTKQSLDKIKTAQQDFNLILEILKDERIDFSQKLAKLKTLPNLEKENLTLDQIIKSVETLSSEEQNLHEINESKRKEVKKKKGFFKTLLKKFFNK